MCVTYISRVVNDGNISKQKCDLLSYPSLIGTPFDFDCLDFFEA